MHVVMMAGEVYPYAKTGGLADVMAALPRALASAGVEVTICVPGYRTALATAGELPPGRRVLAPLGSRMEPADVVTVTAAAVRLVLVRADRYFGRDGIYGDSRGDYGDNAERYAFFCRAVLEWLRGERPVDVLHAHDWHAGLAPAFLRANADLYPELAGVRSVMTIHNIAFQGRFPGGAWHLLNLDARYFTPDFLEFYGGINYLKAGIVFADAVTTVSPRYAAEIETPTFGEGLDGVLRVRHASLRGIVNGIDTGVWDPARDALLPAHYERGDLRGKAACKAALQTELGLEVDAAPALLGIVSRLAEQKGFDLLAAVLPDVLVGAAAPQLAVLGSGDERYAAVLRALAERFPRRAAVRFGYDERLAHRIEAGADVFLMPSRYEPCGLNQLYSLRYGTVPVVHATGGLDDTVAEWDPATGAGTGFKFTPYTPVAFRAALERALATRANAAAWARLVANGMAQDFSWDRAAVEYARLYEDLVSGRT